jgi:uncharacterized damage-inducible protein DinB
MAEGAFTDEEAFICHGELVEPRAERRVVSDRAFPPLEITPMFARVNEELIELVDLFPKGKLNWSPQPERWSARGILLHCCIGRHGMMQVLIGDGKQSPDVLREGQTDDGLKQQLRVSWERMTPFFSDADALAREYDVPFDGETARVSGHWLAFGQIEHDIHHRGEIGGYLTLLGVDHPEPDTLGRRLREVAR